MRKVGAVFFQVLNDQLLIFICLFKALNLLLKVVQLLCYLQLVNSVLCQLSLVLLGLPPLLLKPFFEQIHLVVQNLKFARVDA